MNIKDCFLLDNKAPIGEVGGDIVKVFDARMSTGNYPALEQNILIADGDTEVWTKLVGPKVAILSEDDIGKHVHFSSWKTKDGKIIGPSWGSWTKEDGSLGCNIRVTNTTNMALSGSSGPHASVTTLHAPSVNAPPAAGPNQMSFFEFVAYIGEMKVKAEIQLTDMGLSPESADELSVEITKLVPIYWFGLKSMPLEEQPPEQSSEEPKEEKKEKKKKKKKGKKSKKHDNPDDQENIPY